MLLGLYLGQKALFYSNKILLVAKSVLTVWEERRRAKQTEFPMKQLLYRLTVSYDLND